MKIETREQAAAAGRAAAAEGGVPLHDIGGHMDSIGVPKHLQGSWLNGLVSELEDQGFDTDPDSDGYGWERQALAHL